MKLGTSYYPIRGMEGEFRFASEFSYYQPVDYPVWQRFYFQYFFSGSKEKKSLPLVLKIKKNELVEEITLIKFIGIDELSSEFFVEHDHLNFLALVELSTKEQVFISCYGPLHGLYFIGGISSYFF